MAPFTKVVGVAASVVLVGAVLVGVVRVNTAMRFDALRARQLEISLAGRSAVVTGATSGIGRGIALRLTEAGASVTAVGRDRVRGEEIVQDMKALATGKGWSESVFRFVECDAFLLSNVASCAAEIASGGRLDYLVLSHGMGSMQGRTETAEGLDEKLTLHYWSRMRFIQALLPNLRQSDDARVLSVLSAGVHGTYAHWRGDPEVKSHYSLKAAADSAGFYNDLAAEALSRENPTVSFSHAAPGFVNTNWGTELPTVIRCCIRCLQPLGASPATCAEFMCSALLDPARKGGFHLLSPSAEVALPRPEHNAARDFIWAHTKSVLRAGGTAAVVQGV